MQANIDGADPERVRAAGRAALLAFATNGALVGSLLPRYPEIARALGLGTAELGLVVACFAAGAVAAGTLPERPLRRFGSRTVTRAGTWTIALALWLAGIAAGIGPGATVAFAALLFVAGAGDAFVDVAQNAQGMRVQRAAERSVLSAMHAGWSAGAAIAGAIGTLAATLGVPLWLHLALTGTINGLLVTLAGRRFLPDGPVPADGGGGEDRSGPTRAVGGGRPDGARAGAVALAALCAIALGGVSVEIVGADWSAWFVHMVHAVPVETAGIAVSALLGAQFVGRLLGDRVIDRLGARRALRASLVTVAAGLLLAAASPGASGALAGFALAGLGSAIVVPIAFAGADALPGLAPGRGLAVVGWALRAAAIGVSPLIGLVGETHGLPTALALVAIVAAAALAATRHVGTVR